MADFFTRLAGRTLGTVPVAQPVIPSMFAPQPGNSWQSDASVAGLEVEVEQEASFTPTRATQTVSRPPALVEPSVQSPRDVIHQPIVQQHPEMQGDRKGHPYMSPSSQHVGEDPSRIRGMMKAAVSLQPSGKMETPTTPISAIQESTSNAMQLEHLEHRVQEPSESRRDIPLQMPSVEPSARGVSEAMTVEPSAREVSGAMTVEPLMHEVAGAMTVEPSAREVSGTMTGASPIGVNVRTRKEPGRPLPSSFPESGSGDAPPIHEPAPHASSSYGRGVPLRAPLLGSAPQMHEEERMGSVEIREVAYPRGNDPTKQIQRTSSIPSITKGNLHNDGEPRTSGEAIAPVTVSSSVRVVPQAAQPQTTEATPATAVFMQGVRLDPSGLNATEMVGISQDMVSNTELPMASARRDRSHPYTVIQQSRRDNTQSPTSEQQLIATYDEHQAGARSLQERSSTTSHERSSTTSRQVMEQGTSPQQPEQAARTHTEMQSVQVIAHMEPSKTTNNTADSMEYAQPTTAPTIRVTIGRIDVRAVTSPTPEPKPRTGRQEPKLSLNQYLGRRQ